MVLLKKAEHCLQKENNNNKDKDDDNNNNNNHHFNRVAHFSPEFRYDTWTHGCQ